MGELGKAVGGVWLGYVTDKMSSRVILIPFLLAIATVDLFSMSFVKRSQLYLLYMGVLL